MAFQVNTNVNALNATAQSTFTQNSLSSSLQKLSSGLRINSAKDDASGMAIADSLRSQANTLGQAIRNANDGMGIIQIADKAMDEQVKILDTIKTKATQAAQDGQTSTTRTAIQADINRLIESLDNIAQTTSYNGLSLLSGSFTNKEFQVGAFSNQSIRASIGATSSDKIGHVRSETLKFSALGTTSLNFVQAQGTNDVTLESVVISTSAGTGLGALAEVINKNSNALGGVRAEATVIRTGTQSVAAGDVTSLTINGIKIGDIAGIQANDSDGRLVQAINAYKEQTGVQASTDEAGRLVLTSNDGRAIQVAGGGMSAGGAAIITAANATSTFVGSLTLTRVGANDIKISGTGLTNVAKTSGTAQTTTTLRNIKGNLSADVKSAIGANAGAWSGATGQGLEAGVITLKGAMLVMDIAESAIKQLDSIRSDLGSVQQQMQSTVNNITITQVNVKSAESGIREVDFASESANYSNLNILAQAGSYAMSQANTVQQNILRLLQ
ncbi:flagellin B [Helicobacter canadensis]|uniref:Flagellin n=1 Tax=Helicobacter canadensis MIT 98-5491 TaxID=537970 RepID=C5ZYD2_9HELI|nr:flagellin B [Helicobacter canadensis]EES90150.1 flagellin [Helicobacter canadensis MIT 98-5491]EFR49306.1 putative flagellin B [Helicobacter canadensis MIT 98-5491]STP02345.1 flagellin A [Helicobacter canadensis]